MEHCEIDLETLGTRPGSVILSIGAVMFDPTKAPDQCLGEQFYCVVSKQSCLDAGLTVDPGTLVWWGKQSEAARKVLFEAEDSGMADTLEDALDMLTGFLPPGVRVWSNGANFDQPLLDVAYDRCKRKLPWDFYNSRCHRTIISLHSGEKALRPANSLAHNALEDAKFQAKHLTNIAQLLGLKL